MMKDFPPRLINPPPKRSDWGDALVYLPANVRLVLYADTFPSEWITGCVELWKNYTLGRGALRVETQTGNSGTHGFSLQARNEGGALTLPQLESPESYCLKAGPDGIAARAVDEISLMHAWMTLIQMLQPYALEERECRFSVPCSRIGDWPALKFRGVHLCVFPETDLLQLERMIRAAALMKYSHVILEFWGSLRRKSFPLLGWPHMHEPEDIRPLINAGRELGLEMVPMFNIWGHASGSRVAFGRHVVLDQDPSQALLFEPGGWTWCFQHPDTLPLHLDICRELCDLFGPGTYFHLGCDEAYSHASCDRCREKNGSELFLNHVNALADDLLSKGRRPMIWGDALLDATRWKHPVFATSRPDQKTHEALRKLNRDIVICDWQYSLKDEPVSSAMYFAEQGFDVVLCPWLDLENIRCLAHAAGKDAHHGFMQTTWHTLAEYPHMLPAGAAGGWVGDTDTVYPSPTFEGPGYLANLGQHYRTLLPGDGSYGQAGWNEGELCDKGVLP
ncbi:MAG: family 20 glycosylhydrolase [Opitutales bacterium]